MKIQKTILFGLFSLLVAATGSAREIGPDDFHVSGRGINESFASFDPAVAYNADRDEYLVVWSGDANAAVDGKYEIYGQRVSAATGAVLAPEFPISFTGLAEDANTGAFEPSVIYDETDGQYLVVWYADALVDEDYEIFGQRLEGSTGAPLALNFRISDMGPEGDTAYGAFSPVAAYDTARGEYLVVWHGDNDENGAVDEDFEVYGQRLDAVTGTEIGTDFQISFMGLNGDPAFDAFFPAITYNQNRDEYLVVWHGDLPSIGNDEYEIFGQRLDATGAALGANFRISDLGPDGDASFDSFNPAVAYDALDDQYLVVWQGEDDAGSRVDGEVEIHGQRLDASGNEIGTNDFRISDMGVDGDAASDAFRPSVAYNDLANEYFVVWHGDGNSSLVDEEREIYAQKLDAATGDDIGPENARISSMGPDGDALFDASGAALAYGALSNTYLTVWSGNDEAAGPEIFGQLWNDPVCGNGVVESGEACDDENAFTESCLHGETSCTVCDASCTSVPGAVSYCGDGVVQTAAGETCDDGNTVSDDGCDADCGIEIPPAIPAAGSPSTTGSNSVRGGGGCSLLRE